MDNELTPAVAALQRKLDEQLRAAAETKKTINMLLKMMGQTAAYEDDSGESSGVIRPDQYYGKGLATAAQEYLALRKQACQPEDIMKGLEVGGFDFDVTGWKENDRLRSLSLSLAKNTAKFHRLKNGSFGLRSWYDEEFLKKATSRKATIRAEGMNEVVEIENDTAVEYVPKVGDYVQWEPKGILQFTEPKRITRISEDGAFAFVADSPTGLPVGELKLEEKPTAAKGSAKAKSRPAADRTA